MTWIKKDSEGNIINDFSPGVTALPAGYDPAEWEWTDEAVVSVDRLFFWDPNHCRESYKSEFSRAQFPPGFFLEI